MSLITGFALVLFGISIFLAFDIYKHTWLVTIYRFLLVASSVVLLFYPCDFWSPLGKPLAIIFTLGSGLLCALIFYIFILLIGWMFGLEVKVIIRFLRGEGWN